MALNKFLHSTGCKFGHFAAPPTYTVVESSFSNGLHSAKKETLSVNDLQTWLDQPATPNGLKLLVHQWDPWKHGDRHDLHDASSNLVFPARDKSHYTWLAQKMGLPESYMLNFTRRQPTPVNITRAKDNERIEIICQTPDYSNSFTTLALSHDLHQHSSTGMLCLTAGSMSKILELIFDIPEHSGAPLFIPSLILWIFASMQRRQLRDIHNIMTLIQRENGLLDRSFRSFNSPDIHDPSVHQEKYDEIHSLLVDQHARLTIGLTEYVLDLGRAVDNGLDRIQMIRQEWKLAVTAEVHSDFVQYIWQLVREGKAALQHRDRLLSRIDIQLKVLYNLMQQRIAQEAKHDSDSMRTIADAARRDSLEMKGIAWLTMTFLPMTALASVFSMSSFFTDYNTQSSASASPSTPSTTPTSRLQFSPQFWIFCAITAPVTIFILLGWTFWKEWLCQLEPNPPSMFRRRRQLTHKSSPYSASIPLQPVLPNHVNNVHKDDKWSSSLPQPRPRRRTSALRTITESSLWPWPSDTHSYNHSQSHPTSHPQRTSPTYASPRAIHDPYSTSNPTSTSMSTSTSSHLFPQRYSTMKIYAEGEERVLPGHNEIVRPVTRYTAAAAAGSGTISGGSGVGGVGSIGGGGGGGGGGLFGLDGGMYTSELRPRPFELP